MAKYWREIHGLALSETARVFHIESVEKLLLAIVTAVALVAALLLVGSEDAARDEMIVRSVLAGVVVLGFPLVYVIKFIQAPPRRDQVKQERIEKLQTAFEPNIEFITNEGTVWIDGNVASISVRVQNKSNVTLRDVFVELDRFAEGMQILNLPRKLKPRDEPGPKFDLPPRRTQYVILATVDLAPKTQIVYQFVDRQKTDVSNCGAYKNKLKAYGDGIQPINRFISLSVSENGDEIRFGTASLHIDPPSNID